MQKHHWISQTLHRGKEARHESIHTVWFYLYGALGQEKLNCGGKIQTVVAAEALAFCANENVPCLGWGSGYTGIHTCQILLKWTSVCFIIENEERGDNQAEQSELMTQKRVNAGNWRTLNIHILYIWAILVNFEKIFYPGKKRSKLHGK